MKNSMKWSLKDALLLFLVCVGICFAAKVEKEDNSNPLGCRDMGYQFELKTLRLTPEEGGDNQSMYFFFNQLDKPVSFYQMRGEDNSHSLYLNHVIGARQWAVLSTSERKLKFICTIPGETSHYGEVVDCSQSIRVCEYNNVKYGLNNRGNYWLVNSSTRNGAVMEVVRYGIIPAQ